MSLDLRNSVLTFVFTFAFMFTLGSNAKAETTRHTRTTTTTTVESDDDGSEGYAPPANAVAAPKNMKAPGKSFVEAVLTQTFGSGATTGMAGCKTAELSKSAIKDLKSDCAAWVKEQKGDLGKGYLGNTCEDSCEDCGMSLVRCKVTGTVRYRKPTVVEEDVE